MGGRVRTHRRTVRVGRAPAGRRAFLAALLGVAAVLVGACTDTQPATDVTETTATLRGSVNTGGKPTSYWFRYGETSGYGNETPHRDVAATPNVQNVSEPVSGLERDTLYHFRICSQNQSGTTCGKDLSFQTRGTGILPGFQETTAFGGLTQPTAVRFSPDGRVFVAEKSGLIKVFDGLGDSTPTTFADLRTEVHNFWDRGLLSLALDPDFPARPFVYVAYTYDAVVGGEAPRWGNPGQTSDGCPNPPGATADGCVVSGRVSRLQASGDQAVGEQVLIEDWCQQYPSHSIGDLRFGPEGELYVSGGDGASFGFADYGQKGIPRNPCGDPPSGVGGAQGPPSAEGGALRSQDLLTGADPTGLHGAVLRIDPDTGDALPDNPLAGNPDPNARRIVAHGMRNPFRFAIRPGTDEVWIGDVGWGAWEEINRVADPTDATIDNFGWPCFEGAGRQPGYDGADLDLCEGLYGGGGATAPYHPYWHGGNVVTGEMCPTGGSSISGMAFNPPGSPLPAEFDGALFFSDYARDCIWVMERTTGALPSPSQIKVLRAGAPGPVDIQVGPGGDVFYASFNSGTIRRIHYTAGNRAPEAVASADPTSGDTPLSVSFDGSGSSDPDPGDTLSYAWDLDGDGSYDDGSGVQASFEYTEAGSYAVGLRVTDDHGATATDTVAVTAGDTPPTAAIAAPTPAFTWAVGDQVAFSGGATDAQDGALPASALEWSLTLQHCPSNCHAHPLQDFTGVAGGSFVAPDHEYPSHLELRLTATDSGGLSDSRVVRLYPRTVDLAFASNPGGLELVLNGVQATTPFSRTVIEGSANTISAPSPQELGAITYDFASWSDGGAQTHTVQADAADTYTATYSQR